MRYPDSSIECPDGMIDLITVSQTLWPDHCIIDSTGAEFVSELVREESDILLQKGYDCQVDSYSAFFDNGNFIKTELDDKLRALGVEEVYVSIPK